RGHEAFDRQRGEQQYREKRSADHPSQRKVGKSGGRSVQHPVQAEINDRLNHPGENKTQPQKERGAIMRAAKPNQRVCGIAKAEKCATYFQIEIRLCSAREIRIAQIENCAKIEK